MPVQTSVLRVLGLFTFPFKNNVHSSVKEMFLEGQDLVFNYRFNEFVCRDHHYLIHEEYAFCTENTLSISILSERVTNDSEKLPFRSQYSNIPSYFFC